MLDVFIQATWKGSSLWERLGLRNRTGGAVGGSEMFASEWRWLGTRTTTSVNLGDTSYSSGDKCVLIALEEGGTSAMTP